MIKVYQSITSLLKQVEMNRIPQLLLMLLFFGAYERLIRDKTKEIKLLEPYPITGFIAILENGNCMSVRLLNTNLQLKMKPFIGSYSSILDI